MQICSRISLLSLATWFWLMIYLHTRALSYIKYLPEEGVHNSIHSYLYSDLRKDNIHPVVEYFISIWPGEKYLTIYESNWLGYKDILIIVYQGLNGWSEFSCWNGWKKVSCSSSSRSSSSSSRSKLSGERKRERKNKEVFALQILTLWWKKRKKEEKGERKAVLFTLSVVLHREGLK